MFKTVVLLFLAICAAQNPEPFDPNQTYNVVPNQPVVTFTDDWLIVATPTFAPGGPVVSTPETTTPPQPQIVPDQNTPSQTTLVQIIPAYSTPLQTAVAQTTSIQIIPHQDQPEPTTTSAQVELGQPSPPQGDVGPDGVLTVHQTFYTTVCDDSTTYVTTVSPTEHVLSTGKTSPTENISPTANTLPTEKTSHPDCPAQGYITITQPVTVTRSITITQPETITITQSALESHTISKNLTENSNRTISVPTNITQFNFTSMINITKYIPTTVQATTTVLRTTILNVTQSVPTDSGIVGIQGIAGGITILTTTATSTLTVSGQPEKDSNGDSESTLSEQSSYQSFRTSFLNSLTRSNSGGTSTSPGTLHSHQSPNANTAISIKPAFLICILAFII